MTTISNDIPIDEIVIPEGMGFLSVTGADGDTRIMWDPEVKAERDAAKAAFNAAVAKGMVGHLVDPADGSKGEVIRDFPKKAGKIVMVRQSAGG